MRSSSLKLVNAGIADPSHYRDNLIHEWYLPPNYSAHLEVYIVRQTGTLAFFRHLHHGELRVQGKLYSVTFIQSPAKLRTFRNVLVSLRYCKDLDRGYCLVKGLGDGVFEELVFGGEAHV